MTKERLGNKLAGQSSAQYMSLKTQCEEQTGQVAQPNRQLLFDNFKLSVISRLARFRVIIPVI